MAGTSVSMGANGRLLLLLMEMMLLSSLVVGVVVVSSASFAIAECGNDNHPIAVETEASMQALRSIIGGDLLSGNEDSPSDDVFW